LLVSDSITSYLLPFDVENPSNSAAVEAFKLFLFIVERFHNSQPHRAAFIMMEV
jgi:hypothetical protein